ncbi:MAG: PTS sugar transporter subunit IIA [Phycisphaerae bacterium]|nr:PTS sugar transporter subunit IIA [Phycisphaerae bacterium]
MKISDLLTESRIALPLAARTKRDAITSLVDLIAADGGVNKRDALLDAILLREAQRTTGVGHGFAIPHAKCDAVDKLVLAMGRPIEPIDFDAIDGKPVTLIALLAGPTSQTGPHLLALAALSRIVSAQNVFAQLVAAKSSAEFAEIIRRLENSAGS